MSDRVKNGKGQIRVFVYGTLKEGHANHGLLANADATFLGYDSITGPVRMTDMVGFPGVFRPSEMKGEERNDDGTLTPQSMRGEVWAMEPEGLNSVDMLEGHPTFYRREKWWTDGQKRVWVYLLSPASVKRGEERGWLDPERRIHEGIWRPSIEEKKHWTKAA